jgi:hypothetical protein
MLKVRFFCGVGFSLKEQRPAVELEKLPLCKPPHHVFDICQVNAVAESHFETVAV